MSVLKSSHENATPVCSFEACDKLLAMLGLFPSIRHKLGARRRVSSSRIVYSTSTAVSSSLFETSATRLRLRNGAPPSSRTRTYACKYQGNLSLETTSHVKNRGEVRAGPSPKPSNVRRSAEMDVTAAIP